MAELRLIVLVSLVFGFSFGQIKRPMPRAGIGGAYSETKQFFEDRFVPPLTCEKQLPLITIQCPKNSTLGCYGCDRSCHQLMTNVWCWPYQIGFPRCFCNPGFYREAGPESNCISDCPKGICTSKTIKCRQKSCGCNEVAKCSGCDSHCYLWSYRPCYVQYYDEAHCFCQDGYVRFADGKCKRREDCSNPQIPTTWIEPSI